MTFILLNQTGVCSYSLGFVREQNQSSTMPSCYVYQGEYYVLNAVAAKKYLICTPDYEEVGQNDGNVFNKVYCS